MSYSLLICINSANNYYNLIIILLVPFLQFSKVIHNIFSNHNGSISNIILLWSRFCIMEDPIHTSRPTVLHRSSLSYATHSFCTCRNSMQTASCNGMTHEAITVIAGTYTIPLIKEYVDYCGLETVRQCDQPETTHSSRVLSWTSILYSDRICCIFPEGTKN